MRNVANILFSEAQQHAVREHLTNCRESWMKAQAAKSTAEQAEREAMAAWKEAADQADRFGITYGLLDRP